MCSYSKIRLMDKKKVLKIVDKNGMDAGIYDAVSRKAEETTSLLKDIVEVTPLDRGAIYMVVGPERGGKSIVAIGLNKWIIESGSKRRWAFSQPKVDREDVPDGIIFSRTGEEMPAISFANKHDVEVLFHDNDVVVMDEVQFVPADLQSYLLSEIMKFTDRGGIFVGIGLDYTSQGGEFVFSALLKSRAEKVFKHFALCQMCGRKADRYCQRLINGIPAGIDTPALLGPSDNVTYEPRCEECFVVKK